MALHKINLAILLFLLVQLQCKSQKTDMAYTSEHLQLIPISENSYLHISYLNTDNFGKVACNGLVYINDGEAVVFDTPTNEVASKELITWLTDTQNTKVVAVVINHFHIDALGGLNSFHKTKIPSYSNNETIALAQQNGAMIPQIGFNEEQEIKVGHTIISNRYFGEAHTKDNIISYIADEELLYGGCMIKSLNAGKGNLEDANIHEWSKTILKIKNEYPDLKLVVPGHGKHGSTELLDYTMKLFKTN